MKDSTAKPMYLGPSTSCGESAVSQKANPVDIVALGWVITMLARSPRTFSCSGYKSLSHMTSYLGSGSATNGRKSTPLTKRTLRRTCSNSTQSGTNDPDPDLGGNEALRMLASK